MPTIEQIEQALTQVVDPELGRNIVEVGMVRDVHVDGGDVAITLALTVMGCPLRKYLKHATDRHPPGRNPNRHKGDID